MRILHISNDEKFLDSAITLFEKAAPGKSVYLANGVNKESLKFVKSHIPALSVFPYKSKEYFDFIGEANPDVIFVHGLSVDHKYILEKLGKKYKVYWYSWGRDMYMSPKLKKYMHKSDTGKLLDRLTGMETPPLKAFAIKVLNAVRGTERFGSAEEYLKYIDFMGTVVYEDYELFSDSYPELCSHVTYIPFNYGGVIPEVSAETVKAQGNNILIGNSANADNNHQESFDLLDNIKLGEAKIYVPLSYGGTQLYKSEVIRLGNSKFGKNFVSLTDFMPLQEYNQLLDSVGVAIMNHSHQHAMGNIVKLVHSGVKVYMDPQNSATKSLIRMGAVIFDIAEISDRTFFEPLSDDQKRQNKKVMEENYSNAVLFERTKELVKQLEKYTLTQ